MKLKFPIMISNGGSTYVTCELSTSECDKIILASTTSGLEFSENESLSEIYKTVKEEAFNQMASSIEKDQAFLNYFLAGKYNFQRARELIEEMFEIEVLYPTFE